MGDEEYNKKLESLQQYIPFLNNMITQLKDPRKKNREQQLAKMVSLHSMITDKKKKLKLETLTKCEDVILKLYEKVKSGSQNQSVSKATPLSPITPSSPSPPRDIPKTKPVVIPTEKIVDRSERDIAICQPSASYKPRIDIYSSAAVSLTSLKKSTVFERLGKKTPDMSKPPISLEDLEALQKDDVTEGMSLNELTDLREKLQRQLKTSEIEEGARKSPINTTVRNTTILTKKAVEKSSSDKAKSTESKNSSKSSAVPKKITIIKEASSVFGSTLSSIDNQILEEVSKIKDKERRSSGDKNKDRRNSKDEKRSSSSHRRSKEREKDKTDRRSLEQKNKERKEPKKSEDYHKSPKSEHNVDKDRQRDEKRRDEMKKPEEKPKGCEVKPNEPVIYRRLADKYNPKPRRRPSDAELKSHDPIPKIPFLETSPQRSPTKTVPIPLLSPTSSTSTVDGEVAAFTRKPLLPNPVQSIPTHVSNIISSPSTSSLVNNVVNQFKGRQTPLLGNTPNSYAPPLNQQNFPNNDMYGQNYWGSQVAAPHMNSIIPPGPSPHQLVQPPPPLMQPLQPPHQLMQQPIQPPPIVPAPTFQQRAFTPIPNQFEASMPYSGAPSHQFPPSLRSPSYDSFETRQPVPRRSNEDSYNREREGRYDEWHRVGAPRPRDSFREPIRDPRLHRDPRNHREDPRSTNQRKETKEPERNRDPRLHRREEFRARSLSQDTKETEESFASPLDSLYTGNDNRKTGKGYGMQSFKIPKIRKEDEESEKVGDADAKKDEKSIVVVSDESDEKDSPDEDATKSSPSSSLKKSPSADAKKPAENKDHKLQSVDEKAKSSEPEASVKSKDDENVASTSVSSSTEVESKTEVDPEKKETAVSEISSTNDITDNQSRDDSKELDDEGQTDIINKFLKKLLQNERTRAAASLFIDNVSNSIDDEKLKMVVKTVKYQEDKKPIMRRRRLIKKTSKLSMKLAAKKKRLMQRKLAMRKRREMPDKEAKEEETEDEKKEEVVTTVGERIKTRKRENTSATKKKKKGRLSELDALHEDIQEMFIRDGVLTATGKRMCRFLKNENEKKTPPSPEPKRRTRKCAEKFDTSANLEKLKAMGNVRVLIPKISVEKLAEIDEDGQRYSLRRTNKSSKSYAEVDSDEEKETDTSKNNDMASGEVEKEKPKTKEKKKEVSEEEADKEEEKQKITTTRKLKKRAKSWASGVLPKRRKKIVEEKEPEEKPMDLVEPDKNYYSSTQWHSKFPCKLCQYHGMNITRHYRTAHPESEVLSARLSPQKAEEAIKESLELQLDKKPDETLLSTKRFQFCCRFCDLELHSQPSGFYDHISTHTGEYRHTCTLCDYTVCNIKPLRTHYSKVHNTDKYAKAPWVKTKVYGYICTECNFVQTMKKTVENHVNIYHLGEGIKILKILLSTVHVRVDKKSEEVVEEEIKIEPIDEIEFEPDPKRKRSDENDQEMTPPPTSPKPIKKEKEIDMTVFTCNTNIQEENEEIEQERLRRMTELNETVKTNRLSLNFVDELSNRLMQERQAPIEEILQIKTEPIEDDEFKPDVQFELLMEIAPRKPSKLIEQSVPQIQVVEKDNTVIQEMIQKLQGKLKAEPTLGGPPPLTPLVEKHDDSKAFLNPGFVTIFKTSTSFEFCCRVPSCLFTSTNRDSFLSHWKEDHLRMNQNYKSTICRTCQAEIKASSDGPLLPNFFEHIERAHLGLRCSFDSGFIKIDREREEYEYFCRVNMCTFSVKNRDAFIAHLHEHFIFSESCKMTVCAICQVSVYATPESNILICLLAHLEETHLEDEKSQNKNILRTRRLSGDKLSVMKEETTETKEEDENPFPFKISGVMSLAEETVPPLSPFRDKPNQKVGSIILKEFKLSPLKKNTNFKCAEALKKFLQCPHEMYKCPQFFCKYATSWRHRFDAHLKAHYRSGDEMVLCVYCDVKTPLSHAGLHIDLRHSNCLYSCSVCLYRALTREYVIAHTRSTHPDCKDCNVIVLPPRTSKTIMMSNPKTFSVKEACHALKCGQCDRQFLFWNEFCEHVQSSHNGIVTCEQCKEQLVGEGNIIAHFASHEIFSYHCLLCKVGKNDLYEMLEHYSLNHSNCELLVVDRRAPNDIQLGKSYDYSEEAFTKVKFVKEAILESVIESKTNAQSTPTVLDVFDEKPNNEFVFADSSKNKEDSVAISESSITDPLSLDQETIGGVSGDDSDSQDVTENVDLTTGGLTGYQLYRCAFCQISFTHAREFKAHTINSKLCREKGVRPLKCTHCERLFKNAHGLLEHIQYHGQLRFGCSLCVMKFPSSFSLKSHMRTKHNVTNTITTPVIPNRNNLERDEFVLRPAQASDKITKDVVSVEDPSGLKNAYGPDELDYIPKRFIFNSDIKCALCSYSTKVRTNLVRHLQFHSAEKSVPDIAPVNPVPCLDKNERMFDKMTNLACSSITGAGSRMGGIKTEIKVKNEPEVPAYIPANRRYVCCAKSCNYLCLEEANLRHHLHALHVQEPIFTCSHCQTDLKTDIEAYLKHLKLHDLHLFKCSMCSFVHNLRHKVDKHVNDKHQDQMASTITIRQLEAECLETEQPQQAAPSVDQPTGSNIKWTKPWHCGMCKYRCAAKSDMVIHIFNKHDINTQFKCTLCSYKTDEKQTFEGHFKENHPDNDTDIIYVYYKQENSTNQQKQRFDTTPLWQRDRPRVRHIRGILFEETSSVKGKKILAKSLTTPSPQTSTAPVPSTSNLDLAIEAVAKGMDDISRKEESVILIVDDEEEGGAKLDESGEKELLIDIDVEEGLNIKKEEPKEFLSEEILIQKYGKMCSPIAKFYRCPICLKYKNKKVPAFIHHLLVELNCLRFKCNSCEFSAITFDTIVAHIKSKHDSLIVSNVKDIPLEKTVIYWIQLVLNYQSKLIIKQTPPPMGESKLPSLAAECEYCHKWFRFAHILKAHEYYHWANHIYICDHCCSEHSSLDQIFQHNFLSHPMYDVSFKINGPDVEAILKDLTTPQPQTPPTTTNENVEYGCVYCEGVESTVELLKRHVMECHENEEFGFRVVPKASLKVEPVYCCTYCHERGSDKTLKDHHKEKHEGTKYKIYQVICLECSGTFLNLKDLRLHYATSHIGKKLTYSCIENRPPGSAARDLYHCMKCPFRSATVGGIRAHIRKHLRPIDCLSCGATYVYPTDARAHHSKEHMLNPEKIEENKERLKEYEDLVQQAVAAKDGRGSITKIKSEPEAKVGNEKSASSSTVVAPSVKSASSSSLVAPSVVPPVRKMLARKSTGAPFIRDVVKKDEENKKES